MRTLSFLLIPCFLIATILSSQASEIPISAIPGRQVVQSIELPASTSTWVMGAGRSGIEQIGEPRPLDETRTEMVYYWLFLPANYAEQARSGGAPLLLFLHGAGERGSPTGEDIARVKAHGPPRLLDNPEFARRFPAVTVSPQVKTGYAWSPAQLMLLLDHIEENFAIDKSRIYVTGLSMGGFGTWMCLNEAPERFAAAAPICGGAKPEWAERLTDIPIWVFHGDRDTVVTIDRSQVIVDAIRNAGGRNVIFTIYEGEGHDSWTRTYNNQLLYDWMFQQSLPRVNNVVPRVNNVAVPQASRVRGAVFFQGSPVEGVTVTFHSIFRDEPEISVETDAGGQFNLHIPLGRYMVSFSKMVRIPDEENGNTVSMMQVLPEMYTRDVTTPWQIDIDNVGAHVFEFYLE